jgi:hypothetical protein
MYNIKNKNLNKIYSVNINNIDINSNNLNSNNLNIVDVNRNFIETKLLYQNDDVENSNLETEEQADSETEAGLVDNLKNNFKRKK